jgi:hypothetical protein
MAGLDASLQDSASFLFSARRLRRALDQADPARLEDAVGELEQLAEQRTAAGDRFREFAFTGPPAGGTAEGGPGLTPEQALRSLELDLEVANLLIAAGQAVGEGGQADRAPLDRSLGRLETAARAIEEGDRLAGGFAFDAGAETASRLASSDLPAAIATFRARSADTLQMLVRETHGVATAIVDSLSQIDPQKVVEALGALGRHAQDLPDAGRLVRQGLRRLVAVIEGLIDLLGARAMEALRERIRALWDEVREGRHLTRAIESILRVEAVTARVGEALAADGLDVERLDRASEALDRLQPAFLQTAGTMRSLVAGVALAGSLLALTAAAGPWLALALASAYLVVLSAMLLVAMDYADSEPLLQRVHGVGDTAADLIGR